MSSPDPVGLDLAAPPVPSHIRWLDTLGWAAYLACSWTWCIGMFLPVLLIRDYGMNGWWAFAIPNVVGAAAMGWVLRTRQQSQKAVKIHRHAVRAFSWITLAFHAYFIFWITAWFRQELPWPPLVWPIAVMVLFLIVYLLAGRGADRLMTAGVLLLSVIIGGIGLAKGWLPNVIHPQPSAHATLGLWCLAPVMVSGFLLCPYLDQTFHRARQAMDPVQSQWGFGIGFGMLFAAMIVMTAGYSGWLSGKGAVPTLLLIHLLAQSGITMALHLRDATRQHARELGVKTFCGGIIAVVAALAVFELLIYGPEYGYRLFMGFYGLPFPAYVLICMKPWQAEATPPTSRQWTIFAVAVVLATPAYLLAVMGDTFAFLIGLAFVLGAAAIEQWGGGNSAQAQQNG